LIADVDPAVRIIATRREWAADRPGQLAFAAAHGIAAPPAADRHGRVETTLWGRWIETKGAPADAHFTLTRGAADCPAEAATVEILFERGVPRAINGVAMPLVELIASLGTIAGAHGVGRTQSAGAACEAPAAVLLHDAHRQLEARVLSEDLRRFAQIASREYADLIRGGGWFTPLREALDAFFDEIQERANGTVRLKLFKGQVTHE
jgi:argininosuccinate synthase